MGGRLLAIENGHLYIFKVASEIVLHCPFVQLLCKSSTQVTWIHVVRAVKNSRQEQ